MIPRIQQEVILPANVWVPIVLPDKSRESLRFQAKSLGVLDYSFDAGTNFMQTVGAGDQLQGNFSNVTIWFRTTMLDSVKYAVMDKIY